MNLPNLLAGKKELLALPEPRCHHTWDLFSKTYAPPIRIAQEINDTETLQRALFGLTTYLWECRICSAIRKEEMLGSDAEQLTDIIQKVDKFGMQYIKEGDNTYAIARWVPESETVPLR